MANVRRLQVLATPPAAVRQAEDGLHQVLSESFDPDVAESADAAMWAVWLSSGDETVDGGLQRGLDLMGQGDLEGAIEAFTEVTTSAPHFAEGWNKRATALFLAERFDESIEDCRRVLQLKPRHFGSLSGLGVCYLRKGDERSAMFWMRAALQVNPKSSDFQRIVADLDKRAALAALRARLRGLVSRLRQQAAAAAAPADAAPADASPAGAAAPGSAVPAVQELPPAEVRVEWNALRVKGEGMWTYIFRATVRSEDGEPISCAARYYAVRDTDSVLSLSRATPGEVGFTLRPGESYKYYFMLVSPKELPAAEGGLLLRRRGDLLGSELPPLAPSAARQLQPAEIAGAVRGYNFQGRQIMPFDN